MLLAGNTEETYMQMKKDMKTHLNKKAIPFYCKEGSDTDCVSGCVCFYWKTSIVFTHWH